MYADRNIVYPEYSTNVVAISAYGQNLALRSDGTVLAWSYSPDQAPPDLNHDLVAISAGGYHNLGLRSDGTVIAWGNNYEGATNVPTGLADVAAIAAGNQHNLALQSNGNIVAWGWSGATNVPTSAMPAIDISAGAAHGLALKADGTVVGWGQSTYGEADASALSNVVAIEAGYFYSVALKADGTVVAWGFNYHGQTNVPAGLSNVVAISAGNDHVLALKSDGTVVGWGATDSTSETITPPSWLTKVRAVEANGAFNLVLLEGGPHIQAVAARATRTNYTFALTIPTRSGHVYALEYATNLPATSLTTVHPLVAGRPGSATLPDPLAAFPRKFYRVREW